MTNRAEKRRQAKLAQKQKPAGTRASAAPAGAIPDSHAARLREGLALHQAGRLTEADLCYRQVRDAQPNNADAHHLSGLIAHQLGRPDDAIALMTQALRLAPDTPAYHNNLGLALQGRGREGDAIAHYRRALELQPGFADAQCNLGNALKETGHLMDAVAAYRRALVLRPDFAGAFYNLGNALKELGQLDGAIAAFEAAIALQPDYAKAHSNLGNALKETGRMKDALAAFERARHLEPQKESFQTNIIFMQDFCADIGLADQQAERRRWNETFILPLARHILPHSNDRTPDRRLRIGYVSADFRGHSACSGFAPLILDHDPSHFDVFCYAGNRQEDEITGTLRAAASGWRMIYGMTDAALAETIRADAIDILVDLSGHSDGNRLGVFGLKAAPVQVTGIGHLPPGASTIDYRLTTRHFTPPDDESLYPEYPVYLPVVTGFLPPPDAPDVAPSPWRDGDGITFGCLNRLYKISDAAKALWARILRDVPASRLLIKFNGLEEPATRQSLEDSLAAAGAPREQLILLGGSSRREHLETYNRIDIALDTFPQGGGITTLESLWMGVPVLGLHSGFKTAQRLITTLCAPLELDDWIAESTAGYHRRAVEWAGRPDALSTLRAALRPRVATTYGTFTRDVESAYREMWRRWGAGESPRALTVADVTPAEKCPRVA